MALTIGYVEAMDPFARLPELIAAMKEVNILVEETKDLVKHYFSHGDLGNVACFRVSSSLLTWPQQTLYFLPYLRRQMTSWRISRLVSFDLKRNLTEALPCRPS